MKIETTRFGWKATITKETITKNMSNFAAMFGRKRTGPFLVGDKVKAFGNIGIVKSISTNGMFLEVTFVEAPNTIIFTIDGKIHSWNKRASLEKV